MTANAGIIQDIVKADVEAERAVCRGWPKSGVALREQHTGRHIVDAYGNRSAADSLLIINAQDAPKTPVGRNVDQNYTAVSKIRVPSNRNLGADVIDVRRIARTNIDVQSVANVVRREEIHMRVRAVPLDARRNAQSGVRIDHERI